MNLLTVSDIAALLRVQRRTVADRWVHRPDFPQPRFAPTRRTRLWALEDVQRWASRAAISSGVTP
jgi:hypothetical protein